MKIDSKPKFWKSLAVGFMVYGLVFSPALVFALPSGGVVVSGDAAITQSDVDMSVDQSTDKLIVNWDGFSIGVGEAVQFFQPGVNSVALNRVVGQDPSLILGSLKANGQIFVVNPSGVYLGANAKVDAHGFLATTLGISDDDFLDGTYNFSQGYEDYEGYEQALSSVVNDGLISATSYVGLLAPGVANRGSIVVADLGSVALASGETAVMDFLGDGLINFVVTDAVSGVVLDERGRVMADRINNSGLIRANGGRVLMTAKAAGDAISSVVNHSGIIEAQTVEEKNGEIILAGGDQGVVNVTGLLDASGKDAGETGGLVEITGQQVGLFDFAEVNVSGDAGGGSVRIEAEDIYIDQEAVIHADALTLGDGGTVVATADDVARIYGTTSARGGVEGGDGGSVDTSGGNSLEVLNAPDVSAPNGNAGDWHVTSSSVEIVDGAGRINIYEETVEDDYDDYYDDYYSHNHKGKGKGHTKGKGRGHDHHDDDYDNNGSGSSMGDAFLSFGDGAQLGSGLIVEALNDGATVVVSAEGSEASDVTLSTDLNVTGPNASALTFNADKDVLINADVINSEQAPLDLALHADTDLDGFGDVVVAENSSIFTHNGSIDIQTNDFSLLSPLNSGLAGTTLTFLTGDLYLGNLAEGEQGLSNGELGLIAADHLILNASADVFVQGLAFPGSNIDSFVRIDSGHDINFTEAASVFPALQTFAVNDINVFVDVVTEKGDFIALADSDMDGNGEFNLFTDATITSDQDIDVTVGDGTGTVNADGTFDVSRDLIINGEVVGGEPPAEPPSGSPQNPLFDQGTQGTFLTSFLENAQAEGC